MSEREPQRRVAFFHPNPTRSKTLTSMTTNYPPAPAVIRARNRCICNTHPFNGPFSGTTRVGRYQKSKTNLDFTEARDSEWQWHQLSHMQVCTLLKTDNHASTPPLSFLQAGCPSCRPTNSVKALKAKCLRKPLWQKKTARSIQLFR